MTTNNQNQDQNSDKKHEVQNFKKGKWMTPLILILSVIAFIFFLVKNSK